MNPLLWIWWQGYVTVRLRGPGIERLLNEAAEAGVVLLKVQRLTAEVVIIRLTVSDFHRLRPILRSPAKGSQISVSILDRHGGPFLLRKLKPRTFLLVGLVMAAAVLVYLSSFIWFIEVHGSESIPVSALKLAVGKNGLRAGVSRRALDLRKIEADLLQQFPDLAWAQVRVQGVKAELHLAERQGLPGEVPEAGHLYAKRDGVITELLVLQGTPQVREGDTVLQDELLISGVYYDARGRKQFGAAQGIVKARVWYQGVGEAPLVRWEPERTGRVHRQYILSIGPIRLPLGRSYPQETHLAKTKSWQLSLGSAMVPLTWAKTEYEEVEWQPIEVPRAQAEEAAYRLAWESLRRQGVPEENIIEEKVTSELMEDALGVRITVQVEAVEDIGLFFGQ